MNASFKDKVVVVTGASSGIGRACIKKFAEYGARVVAAARSRDKLDTLEREVKDSGAEILCVQADVSKKEDCKRLIDEAVGRFDGIDVLINNAGISMRALFRDTDLEVIENLMNTNFWGTVYCTKFALPYLLKSKGSVVGVSSIAGYVGLPGRTGYSASKYGMQGFLDALRTENLKSGLHVMVACPHFTASNIRNTALKGDGTPQGKSPKDEEKLMPPEEVAEYIIKGIAKRKRTLVLTSNGKWAVFLNKLFPKLVEKRVYEEMAKEPDSPFEK